MAVQDGTSFLHVPWWQNPSATTTWLSVGLLVADSLEQARATSNSTLAAGAAAAQEPQPAPFGQPTSTSTSTSNSSSSAQPGPRRLLWEPPSTGVEAAAAAAGSQFVNYVLSADNATLVPLLKGFGGISTSAPLLVYVSGNVTVSSATGVTPQGVAMNRFLHWVGLSSRNTSVDWNMEVSKRGNRSRELPSRSCIDLKRGVTGRMVLDSQTAPANAP
jgi:hypothetical protein